MHQDIPEKEEFISMVSPALSYWRRQRSHALSFLPQWGNPGLWAVFFLGICSGLPFLLTLSTLSFWLTESGVDKTTLGWFMLASLPYSLKFLWAPFLDRVSLPYLTTRWGQRRSWALVIQGALVLSLIGLGMADPQQGLIKTAFFTALVAFFSATQDIIYDAYRIEITSQRQGGTAAALESVGFRLGMLGSGAGALYLASFFSWQTAYFIMSGTILLGTVTVLWMPDSSGSQCRPVCSLARTEWWKVIIDPWQSFSYKSLFPPLLCFIFCLKLPDGVLNAMSAPFLHEIGVSKIEFANITKVFGIALMVVGGFLGGGLINKRGFHRALAVYCVFQTIACLCFSALATIGYHSLFLIVTIGVESLCSGMMSTLFIAYLSRFCHAPYTATHFTLLYACGSLVRVLVSAGSGWCADHLSWPFLFFFCCFFPLCAFAMAQRIEEGKRKLIFSQSPPSEDVSPSSYLKEA